MPADNLYSPGYGASSGGGRGSLVNPGGGRGGFDPGSFNPLGNSSGSNDQNSYPASYSSSPANENPDANGGSEMPMTAGNPNRPNAGASGQDRNQGVFAPPIMGQPNNPLASPTAPLEYSGPEKYKWGGQYHDTAAPASYNPLGTPAPGTTPASGGSGVSPYEDHGGYNPLQYATDQTAAELAKRMGGSAVKTQVGGPIGPPPQNLIDMGGGFQANAGLVNNLIQKYGYDAAMQMVNTERQSTPGQAYGANNQPIKPSEVNNPGGSFNYQGGAPSALSQQAQTQQQPQGNVAYGNPYGSGYGGFSGYAPSFSPYYGGGGYMPFGGGYNFPQQQQQQNPLQQGGFNWQMLAQLLSNVPGNKQQLPQYGGNSLGSMYYPRFM